MLRHFLEKKCGSYLFVRSAHTLLTGGVAASLLLKDTELQQALLKFDDLSLGSVRKMLCGLLFYVLTLVAVVMYYVTCLSDPGFVPIDKQDDDDGVTETMIQDAENSDVPLRRCGFCGITQPLRARHCEDCGWCVRKFDHHCPWLDRCIGENNHKYFLIFLAVKSVVISWATIVVWRAFVWRPLWSEWFTVNLVYLLDCIILIPSGITVWILFLMHSYLALVNQTTWEIVSRARITYLKKLDDDSNPFHMGYLKNCYIFLCDFKGKQWEVIYRKHNAIKLSSPV